ncbi:MAG: hypothetical protein OEX14_00170 [Paracoccaceae bacterium]|nr:hypothetical protein [Paracoccaceae bacterium]
MSMYNQLFGISPAASYLLEVLGTSPDKIPRFRDCWFDKKSDPPRIVIYTRTGGTNRLYYDSIDFCAENFPEDVAAIQAAVPPTGPWNSDLRALPGYLDDKDDAFDSTYAYFYFSVPDDMPVASISLLSDELDPGPRGGEAWEVLLKKMDDPDEQDDPLVVNARAVGEKIIGQMIEDDPTADEVTVNIIKV